MHELPSQTSSPVATSIKYTFLSPFRLQQSQVPRESVIPKILNSSLRLLGI
jgi:hypothetical protein